MTSHRERSEVAYVHSGVKNSTLLGDWEMTPKQSATDWLYVLGGFLSQLYVSVPLLSFFPHIDYTVFLSSLSWLQH